MTSAMTKSSRRTAGTLISAAMAALALAAAPLPAAAQTYPSRPLHLIVNFAPGGAGDIIGRIVGDRLAAMLHQPVAVENRSGAGGTIGARDVVNAPPDGYTLTVAQTPEICINPYFMRDVGYDPLKDLQPIALAGVVPLALVVPAKSAYASAAAWAAALHTGQALAFASAGVGTPGHLAGEMLKLKLDNKLVHVPYKGAGPALSDIAGGQVDFFFSAYPSAVALTQSGRIRILAVSTLKRSPAAPDIPTVAATAGIADFDFKLWVGFFGPRDLPKPIAEKLNAAINAIVSEPATRARLMAIGATTMPMSIDQFAGFVRTDIARYRRVIDEANLRLE